MGTVLLTSTIGTSHEPYLRAGIFTILPNKLAASHHPNPEDTTRVPLTLSPHHSALHTLHTPILLLNTRHSSVYIQETSAPEYCLLLTIIQIYALTPNSPFNACLHIQKSYRLPQVTSNNNQIPPRVLYCLCSVLSSWYD